MTLDGPLFDQIRLLTLHDSLHYEQSLIDLFTALGKLVHNLVSKNAFALILYAFVLTTAALSRRFKVTIDKKSA